MIPSFAAYSSTHPLGSIVQVTLVKAVMMD